MGLNHVGHNCASFAMSSEQTGETPKKSPDPPAEVCAVQTTVGPNTFCAILDPFHRQIGASLEAKILLSPGETRGPM